MDLMHVCGGPLIGSGWAIGVIGFGLIVGGIPAAGVAMVTSALSRSYQYRWQPAWHLLFHAGFVVQICSLALTVPMLVMFLISAGLSVGNGWESLTTLFLCVSVVGGCFALRAWRDLMAATPPEPPPSIVG